MPPRILDQRHAAPYVVIPLKSFYAFKVPSEHTHVQGIYCSSQVRKSLPSLASSDLGVSLPSPKAPW